jgi:hypothetical protein
VQPLKKRLIIKMTVEQKVRQVMLLCRRDASICLLPFSVVMRTA